MSVLDRLARVQAARPQGGGGSRVQGIFHQWKEGPNRVRLAGEFLEVRTHFIAPNPTRKDRGLCISAAFEGDGKLPKVINCLNWDIATEHVTRDKTCPVCRLNAIAREILAGAHTDDDKKFFEGLRGASRATSNLKWNIIDRDDPFVVIMDNGKESRVRGFKISTIGPEASSDVFGVFKQVGYDINDPKRGIDIEVIKDSKGPRTKYTARAVVEGVTLKVTPFTAEELAMEMWDLKARCGKIVSADRLIEAFHEDLREMLKIDVEDKDEASVEDSVDAAVAEVTEAAVPPPIAQKAPVKTAPVAGKVPASVLDRFPKKTAPAVEEALGEAIDGDGFPDGNDSKKK